MAAGYTLKSKRTFGPTAEEQIRRIKAMHGLKWRAGITGPNAVASFVDRRTGERTGRNVAELATIHEFGLGPHLPERPFMRITFAQQRQNLRMKGRLTGQDVLEGNGPEAIRAIVEDFVDSIRDLLMGGNDLETLSRRTLDDPDRDPRGLPLVDTEQIFGALTVTLG